MASGNPRGDCEYYVMSSAERIAFSVFLGLLWAWMVIQDTGLVNRWDTTAQVLDVVIVVIGVGLWWAVVEILVRMER